MSIKLNVYNQKAEVAGQMEVSEKIFGAKVNRVIINEAVVAQNANERQVLANTLDRSEVRGGGKKPWRQKGTGRARAGSSRSPIWIGGGITFGPTKDRNFKKKLNKKSRQAALFMLLSDRLVDNRLLVLENPSLTDYKTKVMNETISTLEEKVLKLIIDDTKKKGKKARTERRSLVIISAEYDDKFVRSVRNLAGVTILNSENINIVDLMKARNIILTQGSVKKLESVYKK
jgi:large subunit ribosomal protein L4